MMISPGFYIKTFEGAKYLQLIQERDRLLNYIKEYEGKDIAGDHSGREWSINPKPNVRYQLYLDYLSALCSLMREKYNREYVWGDRKLSDDAKQINSQRKP